jgi:hypothetical protein
MGNLGTGRKSMRATWLLGGTGALLATSAAFASPFSWVLVVDDQSSLPGGLVYEGSYLVVAGNGGAVATVSQADGEKYVMTHAAGTTTLLTGVDDGFSDYSQLAFSPNGTVSFQTNNPSNNFRLHQSPSTGGGATWVGLTNTNITDDPFFDQAHYQVNASGVTVYKYRDAGVQSFSTAVGATTIHTVAEGDAHEVKNFNLPVNTRYRRQAVTASGSVVFYAEDALTSAPAIYRLAAGGTLGTVPLAGITAASRVIGASDNAVLYTALTGPGPIQTSHLTLQIDATPAVTLASYADDAPYARVTNAVMTQQNRVAYFDPGVSTNTASVGYYDQALGDVTIITEGDGVTDDQANAYTLKRISIDEQRTINPMVNDHGIVVFDAVLTPDADPGTDVHALLMWDTQTQAVKIVVKTDGGGTYSDDFGGGKVLMLGFDTQTNQGGDVLKDGLSEANYLAFAVAYSDAFDVEHVGVARVQVPEPSLTSVAAATVAGVLLRRRKRVCR